MILKKISEMYKYLIFKITEGYETMFSSDFLKNYTDIRKSDICYFPKQYFNTNKIICEEFMNNSTSYVY